METQKLTGYPSIDKPWLKYYNKEVFEASLPEHTIFDYLWCNNKNHLDKIALLYFDRKISYRILFDNIREVASAFTAMGIGSGDTVAILSVTTPEVIYSIYALNLIGAVSNMVDPRTNEERIKFYLKNTHTKLVVAIDQILPKVKRLGFQGAIVSISPSDSLPPIKRIAYTLKGGQSKQDEGIVQWKEFKTMGKATSYNAGPYQKGKICTIVYTGGTTGVPKGAMLSNETLNIISLQYKLLNFDYKREQRFLNIMPPFIAYGIVCGIHMPLILGLTNVIVPVLNVNELDSLIIKYKPILMLGVPMHYEHLMSSPKMKNFDLSFWKIPGCGGDGMNKKTEENINRFLQEHHCPSPITKGYGMTELGSAAVTCIGEINKLGSVGIPHCKTVVSVFKLGTCQELTYGQEGEICAKTPATMLGYIGDTAETEHVIKRHADGCAWVHTGDIGYMDEDGFIFIKGRMKRMIIRPDGHNVFPATIENIIMQHQVVEACAVVGKTDKDHSSGKWPVAFVVLKEKHKGDRNALSEIEDYCAKWLPPRDTALEFFEIDQLPLTDIGKVNYMELEKTIEDICKNE